MSNVRGVRFGEEINILNGANILNTLNALNAVNKLNAINALNGVNILNTYYARFTAIKPQQLRAAISIIT